MESVPYAAHPLPVSGVEAGRNCRRHIMKFAGERSPQSSIQHRSDGWQQDNCLILAIYEFQADFIDIFPDDPALVLNRG